MEYKLFTLFGLGILGVLLHNLVEMNKINKESNGNINIHQYLKTEIFSILISVIVVIVAVIASHEIEELDIAGNYLGLGFMAIGYMGQSVLISFMGKAKAKIEK